MKIYLIIEYKRQTSNGKESIWAEVRGFTSAGQRDMELSKYDHHNVDVEASDIEVEKRPYQKPSPQVVQEQTSGLGR